MLTPPVFDDEPRRQDFNVFMSHCLPGRRVGPLPMQPSSPIEERKGSFSHGSNRTNKRRILQLRNRQINNGSDSDSDGDGDGDDEGEEDDNSADDSDAEEPTTPKSTGSTATDHPSPPATPRRVTRSQATVPDSAVPTTPSDNDVSPSKRKRDLPEAYTDSAQPSKGERASKRLRGSIGDSPLPTMQPAKRTCGQQKKFEAKFRDLVWDPQRPGSVEREDVSIKSSSSPWREVTLHNEPWDGSSRSA